MKFDKDVFCSLQKQIYNYLKVTMFSFDTECYFSDKLNKCQSIISG